MVYRIHLVHAHLTIVPCSLRRNLLMRAASSCYCVHLCYIRECKPAEVHHLVSAMQKSWWQCASAVANAL